MSDLVGNPEDMFTCDEAHILTMRLFYFQIEDYMEQLPNHKVPRLGSPGEKYRDIQLIYQLPKQDLSSDFCKMIQTPVEVKEYKVFRELRDNIAMDIGVVKPAHISTVSTLFPHHLC